MFETPLQEAKFRLRCLGAFKLTATDAHTDLTPTSRKARALIAHLALVGRPVVRERLAGLLWGERGEDQARASLRHTIFEIRSRANGSGSLLNVERDSIGVSQDISTDLAVINAAAQSGILEDLNAALAEWRGELFADLNSIDPGFDDWLRSERTRLQEAIVALGCREAARGLEQGNISSARTLIGILAQHDALNESVLRLGLRLDHRAGDVPALHRRYQRFCVELKRELDAAPSGETQRLFKDLASTETFAPPERISTRVPPDIASSASVQEFDNSDRAGVAHAFDVGSTAQTQRPNVTAKALARTPSRVFGAVSVILALVVVTFASALALQSGRDHIVPPSEPLLAVLPLKDLSAGSGFQYFSDGLTEELINNLLRSTHLRVAAQGSSFQLRDAKGPDAERALAATHILSGSVRREGDHVHVAVHLVDEANNRTIWSDSYDRTVAQSVALQQDISARIADALDARLSSQPLREAQLIDSVAYDHFLRGRDLFRQRSTSSIRDAVSELEESVRLTPNFARAWATLAGARYILASHESSQRDGLATAESARLAARRALALDPMDGEAMGVVAMLTPRFGHLSVIDQLFQRALRAEPNNAQLLNWHSIFLGSVGRQREALQELQHAYQLDRATPVIAFNLVTALLRVGRFDEAKTIINLNRDSTYERQTDFARLSDYFLFKQEWRELARHLNSLPPNLDPADAGFYRLSHDTAVALESRERARFVLVTKGWRVEKGETGSAYALQYLSELGDTDGALKVIQNSFAPPASGESGNVITERSLDNLFLRELAPLRRDSRFVAMIAKWGLFDFWRQSDHWPDFCREPGLPYDCKVQAQKLASAR